MLHMFFSLTNFFVVSIMKWGIKGHYMVYKICNVYVPSCFESIHEHIVGPKHVHNLTRQQLNNEVQDEGEFFV